MNTPLSRLILATTLVGIFVFAPAAPIQAAQTRVLKISHQFTGGTIDEGDFRDRLARKFAQEVERRTGGELKFEIYPGGSLVKTMSQFGALSKGALDMTVLPLAYAGGMVPEVNLTLMPALVTSYEQGLRWKSAPIGKELDRVLDAKGVKIVTWIWQAGGNVIWSPVPTLDLSLDVLWTRLDTEACPGAAVALTNCNQSADIWSAWTRWRRNF